MWHAPMCDLQDYAQSAECCHCISQLSQVPFEAYSNGILAGVYAHHTSTNLLPCLVTAAQTDCCTLLADCATHLHSRLCCCSSFAFLPAWDCSGSHSIAMQYGTCSTWWCTNALWQKPTQQPLYWMGHLCPTRRFVAASPHTNTPALFGVSTVPPLCR